MKKNFNWEWLLLTIGCLYLGVSTTRAAIVNNYWLTPIALLFFALASVSIVRLWKVDNSDEQ